ncbi:hypothetical protein ACOJCY_001958 [Cronobacter dublinensis]
MSSLINKDFYEIWRFEECPELIKALDRGDIILFDKEQSKMLWSMFVSSNVRHLMRMDMNSFSKIESYDVDFEVKESANGLFSQFHEACDYPQNVFLFFSDKYLCALPYTIIHNYWNELFLPSDETTIVITPKNSHFLFSYEERFFIVTR